MSTTDAQLTIGWGKWIKTFAHTEPTQTHANRSQGVRISRREARRQASNIRPTGINMTDEPLIPRMEWARWEYEYVGEHLAEVGLTTERRETILNTLVWLGAPKGTDLVEVTALSTTALAGIIEPVLEERGLLEDNMSFTSHDLNQVLPAFERLGICYRIPKFNRDDQFVILPNTRMTAWLFGDSDEDHIALDHATDRWGPRLVGKYLTSELESTEDRAGHPLPVESLLYATVAEYTEIAASDETDPLPASPDDVAIAYEFGQLEGLRDGNLNLNEIESRLSLGTTLPEPDGPWSDGTNDMGLFGEVVIDDSVDLVSEQGLTRRLMQQLRTWLAVVQSLYARSQAATVGVDLGDEECEPLEVLTQADMQDGVVPLSEHDARIKQLARQEAVDAAANRFGIDVTIERTGAGETTVWFGVYRRTGEDDPRFSNAT